MTTLQNTTKTTYEHGEYKLAPGAIMDVPEKIANIWLNIAGVIEYVNPAEAKAKEAKAADEIAKLEKENETLRAELEKLKAEAKAKDGTKTLEELKKEADDLGIEYAKNISAKTLQEKIDAKKAEQK